ncbi:MAG: imidazoleglycerol-phosphate dehydratase HisB [Methanolinea sp.]|nr:imidazoleglycerol-phosphate dehydratase HisB [Methanolinea sp.]
MRKASVKRETRETRVTVDLDLDDAGPGEIATGIPFLDHMLASMARHGYFSLTCSAEGDLGVDVHHTTEDVGIVLGQALREAIGDGRGIVRFAHALVPMDEALACAALDCGGRGYLVFRGEFAHPRVGGIERELFEHFFYSVCIRGGITAHLSVEGKNDHHKCEALFKAFGIALGQATRPGPRPGAIPSTKGTL